MPSIPERFKNAWNAFRGRDHPINDYDYLYGSGVRPDRTMLSWNTTRSIIGSIYNRIAVDVASKPINHVKVDEDGQYKETVPSTLNEALTLNANLDQTGTRLIQDAVITMFDKGVVAIVPTDTSENPIYATSYDIYKLRVGTIVEWYPSNVRVDVYREDTGQHEEIVLPKRMVSIVENPFYYVMNEPNSTLQRLTKVLNQVDRTNASNSSGKLDLIIQLPYAIKSKAREIQAESKRKSLESQLNGSQLGVGYIDATERVIQLNRSLENNLWNQAKDLTLELYNQLGLTQSIFDGTADEKTLLGYYERTISPVLSAITEEMTRKWLTKTAMSAI